MKGIFIILFLFCLIELVLAQGQSFFTIRGQVTDDKTNEPLAFATVALVKFPMIEDILKGVVTDQEGRFVLKAVKDQYTLIIRNLGYRNYVYELRPEMQEVLDLGMIRLKVQPEQLGMVTVKPLVEVSVDEIKYDLSADPDRETASLHAILDKVPLIHRSPMGDLYVEKPGKKFLVVRNGKVDALFSGNLNDILKTLPAKGFASVTVMLAPPERYGEYDYVVNIETDKNARLYGAVGTAKAEEKVGEGIFESGATVIASLNKLRLSLDGIFRNTNAPPLKQVIRKQLTRETELFRQQQKNEVSGEEWMAGSFFSYDLSEQHFLTWRFGYMDKKGRDKGRLESGYENREMTETGFLKKNHSEAWRGGIDYQYDIGTTKRVLNVAYSFQLLPVNRWDQGTESLQWISRKTEDYQHEQAFQVHYYSPLNQYWKLETGGGYLYRYYLSEEKAVQNDSDNSFDIEDISYMKSRKHIINSYLRIDYRRKRFNIGAELKADYMNDGKGTEIGLPERRENISETGLNLMPNVRLSWLFPKCIFSRFTLEYQLKHSRPPFHMLSTYEDVSNADYIQVGNPDLKSQKKHLVRLSTSFKKFIVNAVWSYSGDRISEYWYLDEMGRTVRTYENQGYTSDYTLSSNYSYRQKGFTIIVMLGGSYSHGEMLRKEKRENWTINTSCSSGYTFKNQFNVGLTLGYNERFESGYSSFQFPVWSLAVWGKKKLFKERVELEVYYSDLTRFTNKRVYAIQTADFRMDQQIEKNYIPLTIKMSWRIGSFKLKPMRNIRKSVVVDDTLEE